MTSTANKGLVTDDIVAEYIRLDRNSRKTCRTLGISPGTLHYHLRKATGIKSTGIVGSKKTRKAPKLKPGEVKRYLITAAQNNTDVPDPLWNNWLALAEFFDAEIIVGTMTYNTTLQDTGRAAKGTKYKRKAREQEIWFDHKVVDHIVDDRMELAPGLVWVGDANIIPTAANPLSGFETLTGIDSAIFPASKIRKASVPTGKYEDTKFNYTTGTVTKRNYIAKKAGMKADFHHTYGGLIVEVDSDGDWFVRQLDADGKWRMQDLDVLVRDAVVSTGNPIESATWGDIHCDQIDLVIKELVWGEGGVIDILKPKIQFMHDILDQRARNHHDIKDPHKMFAKFVAGHDKVDEEIERAADFSKFADRPWCKMVVVDSNHDRALSRWLREQDYRHDPVNALYFLEAQKACYDAMARQDHRFHLLEWAMQRAGTPKHVKFLRPDESFLTCTKGSGRGIEHGFHGDEGLNGSRGSAMGFAKLGRKVTTGHPHTSCIWDGVHQVGTFTKKDVGYNTGPSSWSPTFGLDYPNGKRTLITIRNGKWRVPL